MIVATPKITWSALAVAVLAWLYLLFGLVYANFFVTQSSPNPVIVFSAKGLTSLLFELGSLAIGCLGLLLVLIAFVWSPRNRMLACAAAANAAACLTCVALIFA